MKRTVRKALSAALALALIIVAAGSVNAASSVYVNDGNSVLGTDIGSAYAVGRGEAGIIGGSYVITGGGTVKLGQAATGDLPSATEDGSTVNIAQTTMRIGLKYYYSDARDTSLETASLENEVGGGYEFGYYDNNRVFHAVASTTQRQITMKPTGSGREVSVYISGTETVLYTHTNQNVNLAVHPLGNAGKAITWFKGYTYYGDFEYFRYISNRLTVINILDIEDYVKGVVPIEMSTSWPIEALKAQALCARTYAARSMGNYSKYGFDITNDTYCQAYLGTSRAGTNSNSAVDATRGKYITYNGSLCTTFYFSSDGGGTENSENIFASPLAYCKGVIDPYEDALPVGTHKYQSWTVTLTGAQIAAKLGSSRGVTNPVSLTPTYSATNNVIKLVITDSDGSTATLNKSSCYSTLGLPSVHYTIEQNGDTFTFTGAGWGHSVGMSQWGAYSMAYYYGCNYLQIIRFYFTGVNISTGV